MSMNGGILGDPGAANRAKRSKPGDIVAAKVFYKSIRAPGKRVSPDHF